MKTSSSNKKQHIIYGLILVIVISCLVYLGNYQVKLLQQDYNSRISSLKKEVDDKINKLDSNVENLDQLVEDMSKDYDFKLKELSKTSEQFGSQIKQLEDTSKMYEMQIGNLDQQLSDLAVESESFSSVISDVIDSVVSVVTNLGQGSGAIISSNGLIVTNYHVIEGIRRASVMTYDGNTYRIGLVGYDEKDDIAVLKINSNETFNYFDFGDSDKLKSGQKVVALGNPAGLSFTAAEGIVSSPSRLEKDGLYYIQTDVTLNPGNSGGPLINSKGELIGIVNFKVSGYEGLGFAIPSNRAEEVIEEIID